MFWRTYVESSSPESGNNEGRVWLLGLHFSLNLDIMHFHLHRSIVSFLIMQLRMTFRAVLCACLLLPSSSANHMCRSCIPLSDLLNEAYGIQITKDGLSAI